MPLRWGSRCQANLRRANLSQANLSQAKHSRVKRSQPQRSQVTILLYPPICPGPPRRRTVQVFRLA
ncbi:pentapeptide repeat-containing protein [Pseudarthrobacter sp. NIBRBAC000502772]|uniref:pentapeptide repeat-containing protein n=1 Tax=Pseudarthrobacter sp. NIBRBAC000502772 TaxID=2590775 RepID=UPI00143DCE83